MRNWTRRDFLAGVGAVGLAGALGFGRGARAAVSGRPNILLVFPDEHRFDWTGANDDLPLNTPHLDSLAARGVRFDNCVCSSPLCAPSRACLAAGVEYDRCGVGDNSDDYPLAQTTFYRLLRDAGYYVGGVGKFDLSKGEATWSLDGAYHLDDWGFSGGCDCAGKPEATNVGATEAKDPYMKYMYDEGMAATHVADMETRKPPSSFTNTAATPLADVYYHDNWVGRKALDFIENAPAGQPWFLQANFVGPHYPMDITSAMAASVAGRDFPLPHGNTDELGAETHRAIRRNYAAMIENIDAWLGQLVDAVDTRGQLEDTLVVFASDHGEMLGDRNLWRKSQPYHPSLCVPLVAAGPGVVQGAVSSALVSLIDLADTFLDIGGAERPAAMDARSFRAVLEGRASSHRAYAYSGLTTAGDGEDTPTALDWRLVFDGRFKLVRRHATEGLPLERLYDLDNDPWEETNVESTYPDDLARLQAALASGESGLPRYLTSPPGAPCLKVF